jgi:hypothetical protein
MPTEIVSRPTVEEIEAADNRSAGLLSDLDHFKTLAEKYVEADSVTELDDETLKAWLVGGIVPPTTPRDFDADAIARLLVFADDMLGDLPTIEQDARAIRDAALTAYRHYVIERLHERHDV